jgi:hypothetical protein
MKTMKRLLTALVLASTGVASSNAAGEPPVVPKHLELARELLTTVKPENNNYEVYGPGRGVRWKGDLFARENAVNTACVGFVTAVLERAGSPTPKAVASKTSWKHELRVNNYYESVEKGFGLQKIGRLNDAEPGDLFLFSCKDMCANSKATDIQGHITFIDEKPIQKNSTPPLIDGTLQWLVTVIDSADAPHGLKDTRWSPQGEPKRTGVGRGTYRVYTDMSGVPIGYTNGPNQPKLHEIKDRPIVIGRPMNY